MDNQITEGAAKFIQGVLMSPTERDRTRRIAALNPSFVGRIREFIDAVYRRIDFASLFLHMEYIFVKRDDEALISTLSVDFARDL